ncbi:MAG TPA: hypothetical protein EYP23_04220 [Thermoplasmata archaeon]|nr:hypothetical protein [Thermoplasmata archaeon]
MQVSVEKRRGNVKKEALFVSSIFFLTIMFSSGCLEQLGEVFPANGGEQYIQYERTPTTVSYRISYGYNITSSGKGTYTVTYFCFLPHKPFDGSLSNLSILYPQEYMESTKAGNTLLKWEINGKDEQRYTVGVEVEVVANSFIVDLNGENAFNISNIPEALVNQYCHVQSTKNSTSPLIDPVDHDILVTALSIKNTVSDENSFTVAKKLFLWLKDNTSYKTHEQKTMVQPAIETFRLKTGDCDDLSFLYISLCRAAGIPARFIRGYLIESSGGKYYAIPHVWAEVFVGVGNNGWLPVECAGNGEDAVTEMHQNFGVEDAYHLRLLVDDGSNESLDLSLTGPLWKYQPNVDVHLSRFMFLNDVVELNQKKLTVYRDGRRVYLQ